MCKIIAVANQKGGAGKTTTTKNYGYALAKLGKKVLLIDFDPQYSLTTCLGIDNTDTEEYTIPVLMDLVMENKNLPNPEKFIRKLEDGIDLIQGNLALSFTEMKLVGVFEREYILKSILDVCRQAYDYILIDCNPSLGMLVLNALAASDTVLVPVDSNFLASKGLELFLGTLFRVRKRINPNLEIDGILLTKYSDYTKLSKKSFQNLEEAYGDYIRIYETKIPTSVKVGESDEAGISILKYAPNNPVSEAYIKFTQEAILYEQA